MGDLLFCNGSVFDGFQFLPSTTRVRVAGERIVDVGPDLVVDGAEIVDLDGGTVLPGFIDAHVHPVFAGNQLRHCDLGAASDQGGYVEAVRTYADTHPDEPWITGGGWLIDAFEGGLPRREALDAVVPDRPVFLMNADGHGAWVNSEALRIAGIDRDSPQPADGRIEVDPDGEPIGMLQEGAMDLLTRCLPHISVDDWYAALLVAQDHLLSVGVTSWQDAIVGAYAGAADPTPAYQHAARQGTLIANVIGALWWDRDGDREQIAELVHRRETTGVGRFQPTSVKLMLDGVIENHTAAMLDPYVDHDGCQDGNTGIDFIDRGDLIDAVVALDALDFQLHFHALGDRAVRHGLDALTAAREARSRAGSVGTPRHHLAHLQVIDPADVGRFAALGATANLQPLWATHEPAMDDLTLPYLGEQRARWQYAFRSLQAAGARLCAGSDWPVSSPDPLQGVHVAVNRTPPDQPALEPLEPKQSLSRLEILAAYTSGSAWICGLDGRVGEVRSGLEADLAVVDADLSTIPDAELGRACVTQTWVRGELRHGS